MILRIPLLSFFFLFFSLSSFSQDLENIAKTKAFQISGDVNATASFYNFSSKDTTALARGVPLSYTFSGSLNASVFGISVPLSFTYSNNQKSYRQPFNQFGLSPYYKWVKLHIGYRSLVFSPYTLNGHTILGAGVDLTPSHFRFSFIYGRFNRAISEMDPEKNVSPMFSRKGMAFKIGYGGVKENTKSYIDLILLKVKDISSSLAASTVDSTIQPAENFVAGISSRFSKGKIFFETDAAYSIYTSSINSSERPSSDGLVKITKGFLAVNNSTQFYTAYSTALGYKAKLYGIKLQYKRISPNFKTMGSYYLNSDFENYTITPNASLFKKKLILNGSFGVQRDNLRNTKNATSMRKIGSANVSYNPSQKFGMTFMYSNYTTDQQRGKIPVVDSTRLYQTSQNIMLMPRYTIIDSNMIHMFMLSYNNMWLNDKNPGTAKFSQIRTHNFLLNYIRTYIKSGFSVNLGLNYTILDVMLGKSSNYGLSWGLSKSFLKDKLSSSFSNVLNIASSDDSHGIIININASANYALTEHHSFGASVYYNNNTSKSEYTPSFNEFRGSLNYIFRF
jgi:hypothetical protein